VDAAFNLGRLGLLVAGLADRGQLARWCTEDRLHQGPRTALFPEAPALLGRLEGAGALAASWSGAGTSLIGICDATDAPAVRAAGEAALDECGVAGRAVTLEPDLVGLVVDRGADEGT